ncbi:hypothetical protein [Streptomyces sp. Je 1-332]|uniref:hypothetical protein n=1 Tax=Streptomyces sp. Je 1-332 TaxID=3231270 RepID=UPI003458BD09
MGSQCSARLVVRERLRGGRDVVLGLVVLLLFVLACARLRLGVGEPGGHLAAGGHIWKKKIGKDTYLAVYNLGTGASDIKVDFKKLGAHGKQQLRDVVDRENLGSISKSWTANDVPAHGSRLIKLS